MGDRTTPKFAKTPVKPGYSQLHWAQLLQRSSDLSGRQGRPVRRDITYEEVSRHNTEEDCWTILENKVYNITPYLKYHPGGVQQLMLGAGVDCTDLFMETHQWVNGHSMLDKCLVGTLDPNATKPTPDEDDGTAAEEALDVGKWIPFELLEIQPVSKMTYLYRFALPDGKTLGLKYVGQHLMFRVIINGHAIERPYTPVTSLNQKGSFDLLIKIYPDGVMSQYLSTLEIGQKVEMHGPRGAFGYSDRGTIRLSESQIFKTKYIGMVAAGSGITPMLQLLQSIFNDPQDSTVVSLIYCNRTVENIIARLQLEKLEASYPFRFRLHHVLSEEASNSELKSVSFGRLSHEILKQHLPSPSNEVYIMQCGPPSFDKFVSEVLQAELKYPAARCHVF